MSGVIDDDLRKSLFRSSLLVGFHFCLSPKVPAAVRYST